MKKEAIVILYILIILVPLFTPKKLLGAEIVTESTRISRDTDKMNQSSF